MIAIIIPIVYGVNMEDKLQAELVAVVVAGTGDAEDEAAPGT
jgi:hypothetical protein